MSSSDHIERQIKQEMEELLAVPKIPLKHFMGNRSVRCQICGRVYANEELREFDSHTNVPRMACELCHPDRGNNG